jgi:hypothetical protein
MTASRRLKRFLKNIPRTATRSSAESPETRPLDSLWRRVHIHENVEHNVDAQGLTGHVPFSIDGFHR